MARKTVKLNTRFDHPLEQLHFYAGLPQENDGRGRPKAWLSFFMNDVWLDWVDTAHDSYNRVMLIKNCNIAPMASQDERHMNLRIYHAAIILLRNNDIRRAFFVSTTKLLDELMEKYSPETMLDDINPDLGYWFSELHGEVIDSGEVPINNGTGPYDAFEMKSFPGWPDAYEQKEFKKRVQSIKQQVPMARTSIHVNYQLMAPGIRLEAWHYCLMENRPFGEICLVQKDIIAPGMMRREP